MFGWCLILLVLNIAQWKAQSAIANDGILVAAFNLFDISAIVWVATAAAASLLIKAPEADMQAPRLSDWLVLAACIVAALIPSTPPAGIALTGLALWMIVKGSHLERRAGYISAAVAGGLVWGHVLLKFFGDRILQFDGKIVGLLSGTGGFSNVVYFNDGQQHDFFLVAPGCSSLHGISLGFVLWITIIQYFEIRIDRRALVILAIAILSAIAINIVRLAALANFPDHFDLIHTGWIADMVGFATLLVFISTYWIGFGRTIAHRR